MLVLYRSWPSYMTLRWFHKGTYSLTAHNWPMRTISILCSDKFWACGISLMPLFTLHHNSYQPVSPCLDFSDFRNSLHCSSSSRRLHGRARSQETQMPFWKRWWNLFYEICRLIFKDILKIRTWDSARIWKLIDGLIQLINWGIGSPETHSHIHGHLTWYMIKVELQVWRNNGCSIVVLGKLIICI